MGRPGITVRLGSRGQRVAVVLRVEGSERLILGPVAAAALLGAAILWAAAAPPTVGGVSVAGCGLLAVGLRLVARLLASGPGA
jgi:hypothetical protein